MMQDFIYVVLVKVFHSDLKSVVSALSNFIVMIVCQITALNANKLLKLS